MASVVSLPDTALSVEDTVVKKTSVSLFAAVIGDMVVALTLSMLTTVVVVMASLATTVTTTSSDKEALAAVRSVVVESPKTITGAPVVGASTMVRLVVSLAVDAFSSRLSPETIAAELIAMASTKAGAAGRAVEVKGTGASGENIGLEVGMSRDGRAFEHRLHLSRDMQLPPGQGAATHFQFEKSQGTSKPQSSSIKQSWPSLLISSTSSVSSQLATLHRLSERSQRKLNGHSRSL